MMYHDQDALYQRSTPLLTFQRNQEIISRTDSEGNILFYNKTFAKISGYSREELFHAPHNIVRHPDMPKAVFYLIWQRLLTGIPIKTVIKNANKEGEAYWVTLTITPQRDIHHKLISFTAQGFLSDPNVVRMVAPLYAMVLADEKRYSMHHAVQFLSHHLVQQGIASYNDYIHRITQKKPSGILASLGF